MAGDPVEMAFNTPSSTFGMPMRILAYDAGTKTINLYDTSLFRKLGTNGFYIASWYQSKLYNPHIHPDVKFIVGGKEYKAGDLFADNAASFIPKRITDYVQKAITPAVEDDIVTPSHWDCMEGRQLSIFFDCLSRHDGKENLYVLARGTNAPSLTRNESAVDENEFPTAEELPATIAYGKLKTLMNIRKKPSLDAEVVAVYKKNALVEVVQFCDGWLKIKCAEAEDGVAYVLNSADTYAFTAGRIYTVVPGDNLWKIADKELGSGSRCADIRVLNGLTSNAIRVGMKLLIP